MPVARTVFWLALGIWLGTIVFFSFVIAPTIFGTFEREQAGAIIGAIFPRYYLLQAITGIVAIAMAAMMWRHTRTNPLAIATAMLAVMLIVTAYAGTIVEPQARALRIAIHSAIPPDNAQARFDTLHHRAVQLNAIVLLLGIATTAMTASTMRPRERSERE